MLGYLSPNFYFGKFNEVTPEFLIEQNIKALLIDIDNTIAPYELLEPDEDITLWFNSLKENGISFAFISNNSSDKRINQFNKSIGAPAFAKSKKPFAKKAIRKALDAMNVEKENVAFMGDQIFTDICAGKFYGMRTIFISPITETQTLLFKFKRALEKPVLKHYFKKINR